MAGADQPEDLRCACKTKFAEVTEGAISIGCDGCDESLILPFRCSGAARGPSWGI